MISNIVFYNVENLFDTIDDPSINDEGYLPESKRKWFEKRYQSKLQNIAKVIKAIEAPCPAVIGFAEIENRQVLADLIVKLDLTEEEVGVVHADSPDERGMDVGLLYRKDQFRLVDQTNLKVTFPSDPDDQTRDILHVALVDVEGSLCHFYVNHWPSRKEGQKITQVKRIDAARKLREHINQVLAHNEQAKIVVMGDLNCTPDSPPVYRLLDEKGHPENPLINLGWTHHYDKKGSTNYKGKWLLFDQILISKSIKDQVFDFKIVSFSWMLFYNEKYNDFRPNKTYGGKNYFGGFSDHLPVTVSLQL